MSVKEQYNMAVIERNNLRKVVLSIRADIELIQRLPDGNAYKVKNFDRFVFHRHRAERALAELNIKITELHFAYEAEKLAEKGARFEEKKRRAEEMGRRTREKKDEREKRVATAIENRRNEQEYQAQLDARWQNLSMLQKILRIGRGKK